MSQLEDVIDALKRYPALLITLAIILLDLAGIIGYFSYKLLTGSYSFALWEVALPFLAILSLLPILALEYFFTRLCIRLHRKLRAQRSIRELYEKRQNAQRLSVVGIIRLHQVRQTNIVATLLGAGLGSYLLVTTIVDIPVNLFIIYILGLLLVSVLLRRIVIDYRIGWGHYGNNEREAREIIDFIMSKSSKIDFFGGGKPKEIISEEDLEEIRQLVPQELPSDVRWRWPH